MDNLFGNIRPQMRLELGGELAEQRHAHVLVITGTDGCTGYLVVVGRPTTVRKAVPTSIAHCQGPLDKFPRGLGTAEKPVETGIDPRCTMSHVRGVMDGALQQTTDQCIPIKLCEILGYIRNKNNIPNCLLLKNLEVFFVIKVAISFHRAQRGPQ
jgi:hypothetical protein